MTENPMPEVLARLHVSPARRAAAIVALLIFGGLLITLTFLHPPSGFIGKLFLLGLGTLAIVWAENMRRSTQIYLELTEQELRDSNGRVLTTVENITGVERGAFAFKPSNGFLLRLKAKNQRAWFPGFWWSFGRSIGIGGVTNAREGKYMAEIIAALLSERR